MGKSLLRTRGKVKARADHATKRLINQKFYGKDQPPVTDRGAFLTWCNFMIDPAQAREWLETYLQGTGRTCKGVPAQWMNPSVCHRARLKSTGAPFTATQERLLEEGIASVLSHSQEVDDGDSQKLTINDRVREKFSDIMGELEGMLDDYLPDFFPIEQWAREKCVSPTIASRIVTKLKPRLLELESIRDDEQLREAYAKTPRIEIQHMKDDLKLVIGGLQRMLDNEKRARVPRKAKPPSLEKKLKHINESYLKHSKEWNITSLEPAKVVKSKELWTLNVKYKLLTVFRAEAHGGQLDVARCKISGFNKNDSYTYRLGRGQKGTKVVEAVLKSSPASVKELVRGLKVAALQERINENTVLLRVR